MRGLATMILAFLSVLGVSLQAQTVEGTIVSKETNSPLSEVNIVHKKSDLGTVSDANGRFILDLQGRARPGDTVAISSVGYESTFIEIRNLLGRADTIFLSPKIAELNEVIVAGDQLKRRLDYLKLASIPKTLTDFAIVVADQKLYLAGGLDKSLDNIGFRDFADGFFQRSTSIFALQNIGNSTINTVENGKLYTFNPDKNEWSIKNNSFGLRSGHKLYSYKEKLFVVGGLQRNLGDGVPYLAEAIEILDLNSEKISTEMVSPHHAVNFASDISFANLLILGGAQRIKKNGEKVFSTAVHVFNFKTGLWYKLPDLKKGKETQGVFVHNKFYTVGGFDGRPLREIESYDFNSGIWQTEAELFERTVRPGIAQNGDLLYIYEHGNLLVYDTQNKLLKAYRINLYVKEAKLAFLEDKIFIVGGFRESNTAKTISKDVFAIAIEEFKTTAPTKTRQF